MSVCALRGNFTNLPVFPDDHRQTAPTKFGPFLARGATMSLRCGSRPFRHILLGNRFQSVMRCLHLCSKNVRPLNVDSSANISRRPINSRSSLSRSLPALNATASGLSGDNPRAISSAFKNRITPMLGRNSLAKVVLPAPLQPAIR